MIYHIRILLFILLFISSSSILKGQNDPVEEYLKPLLLPDNHPIKQKLDKIFFMSRASLNLEDLVKAGFEKHGPRKITRIVVTRHPSMPGFLFKLYLNSQIEFYEGLELEIFIKRITGANIIRKVISEYGLEDYFCVPLKWIYKIPSQNIPHLGCLQRKYLLVVEDMNLFSRTKNIKLWRSNKVTHDLLDKLYIILKKASLSDGAKPSNIPFTRNGRIAFIDTQNYDYPDVNYKRLLPFLSKDNRRYWNSITSPSFF